jgi:hypothetical protein
VIDRWGRSGSMAVIISANDTKEQVPFCFCGDMFQEINLDQPARTLFRGHEPQLGTGPNGDS